MQLQLSLLIMAAVVAAVRTIDIELTAAVPSTEVCEGEMCFIDDVDISKNGNAWDQIIQKRKQLLLIGDNEYDHECHDAFLWTKYENRIVIFDDKVSLQKRIGRFANHVDPDALCDGEFTFGVWFRTSTDPQKLKRDKKRRRSSDFASEQSLRKRHKLIEEKKEDEEANQREEENHNRPQSTVSDAIPTTMRMLRMKSVQSRGSKRNLTKLENSVYFV